MTNEPKFTPEQFSYDELDEIATELYEALELLEEVAGETVKELNDKCGLDNDTTTETEVARDCARLILSKARGET